MSSANTCGPFAIHYGIDAPSDLVFNSIPHFRVYHSTSNHNWYKIIEQKFIPKGTLVTTSQILVKRFGPVQLICELIRLTDVEPIYSHKKFINMFELVNDVKYYTPNDYYKKANLIDLNGRVSFFRLL